VLLFLYFSERGIDMGTIGDIEKEEEEKEIAMKDTELIPGEE
jgi:hypothetical protein